MNNMRRFRGDKGCGLGVGLGLWMALAAGAGAGETAWTDIPQAQWRGMTAVEVPALDRRAAAAVALPVRDAMPLSATSATVAPAGLYEIRLTLRPSHVADAIAFNSALRVSLGGQVAAGFAGQTFARAHQPESRTCQAVQPAAGPLALVLEAYSDANMAEQSRFTSKVKKGGPSLDGRADDGTGLDVELEVTLTPDRAVYYLVDKIEYRPLSLGGRVTDLACNKIRYAPGETLKGHCTVTGEGTLALYLERGVRERTRVKSMPVTPGRVEFEIPLPREELGYALVAEFLNGAGRCEVAEYFTIAENFQRVALFGANPGGTRDVTLEEEPIRNALAGSRADYFNACEYPFWAPDDLLEMTPDQDYWFSGQANYHMNKPTLQRQIRLAHEQGIAMVTYGKWCVSGPAGWEAVYDRPWDFGATYSQPIGSWDDHSARIFDLRRNGEQVPYSPRPGGKGAWFDAWWSEFIGITPDPTPGMIRSAAEETARSAALFGWDGVRWDGHPRAGWNATGRSGNFEPWAARQTQTLVRYFKDVVAQTHPCFRHGYNYFLIERNKTHAWAKEDFELDELARGGGLLMNESIGNASAGWTFAEIVNNLQVEGDLARERGGYYLGISFARSPRDRLIESALWAAAGCRPYNDGMTREVRRYCTRYAQYSLDEKLRRIATPGKVLAPVSPTRLQWQPFVYETPDRKLVVNLLNLPLDDKRPPRDGKAPPVWTMPEGTDPVSFILTLPAGLRATAAHLIDPQTLEVTALPLRNDRFDVPAVASWSVAVIDLEGAPSLADLYGPPKTLGVPRDAAGQRLPEVVIEPGREVWEVNKNMAVLQPEWKLKQQRESAVTDVATLKQRRAEATVEKLSKEWWKGGVLPDDLKRQDTVVDYGNLAPQRNGRMDIFYGRGAMDYRLRMPAAFAGLPRFHVHDAPFRGAFRGGGLGGMGLENNVPWARFPEFDVLLFTGIPYAAIGIDNCYALPAYVKAGGGVFFTGGEWAFGKGGYFKTVLERELLPVESVELQDSRTSPTPVAIGPGKDFAELKCEADFAGKPSFWVYNQVLLKDGAKVFLASDKGPVLVGWQLGKGRVACLLVDYRGKSGNGTTAYFDWAAWPGLARAVLNWVAPEAGLTIPGVTKVEATSPDELTFTESGEGMLERPLDPDRVFDAALALPALGRTARVEEGRRRVADWNAAEKSVRDKWTDGKGFSVAAPELPCLDADSLFQRVAWLAYLSRHDAKTYGAQFAREWLMTAVYQDYCGRSLGNKKPGNWKRMRDAFGELREASRPVLEALPADVLADGFREAHFTAEYWLALNVLGDKPADASVLTKLKTARNPDLAAFAAARLEGAK